MVSPQQKYLSLHPCSYWTCRGRRVYRLPACPGQPFSRQFLEAAAVILQEAKYATSTQSTQNSMQRTWFKFAAELSLRHLPPDGHELVLYTSWLICAGHCSTPGSLRQYLSSIRTLCRKQGLYCPSPTEYGPLQFTVEGMARRFPGQL
jgi:hypothetical protein